METNKHFGAKTTAASRKSAVGKAVKRKKKDPYEVPVKKMDSHKSRFKPKMEIDPVVITANDPPVTIKVDNPPVVTNDPPVVSNETPDLHDIFKTPEKDFENSSESSGEPEDMDVPVETSEVAQPEEPNYSEYYANGYCLRDQFNEQYYARDETNNEYYWKDSDGVEVYANRGEKVDGMIYRMEYPAVKDDNTPAFINDGEGKPRYPVNLDTQTVIFPRDPDTGEEMYLTDKDGEPYYPENKFGEQFYRKDLEGNDVSINRVYAVHANGSQKYPRKANGDQYYLMNDNVEIAAVKRKDNKVISYYAMRANGDEIYPRMYLEEEDYVEH